MEFLLYVRAGLWCVTDHAVVEQRQICSVQMDYDAALERDWCDSVCRWTRMPPWSMTQCDSA